MFEQNFSSDGQYEQCTWCCALYLVRGTIFLEGGCYVYTMNNTLPWGLCWGIMRAAAPRLPCSTHVVPRSCSRGHTARVASEQLSFVVEGPDIRLRPRCQKKCSYIEGRGEAWFCYR